MCTGTVSQISVNFPQEKWEKIVCSPLCLIEGLIGKRYYLFSYDSLPIWVTIKYSAVNGIRLSHSPNG